ncbi:Eco57I restriction-modification methylase domain-containing protein [Rhodoblastus sp.]|jgi:type I restriction-modification system DNA methylase subunit|uniref:Eco57I restriction-modification methylase domain-containing protein n=1 Tax=Rhodoblastus sp. TaxID=1962975 RepID=UPI0025F03670|nr:Eco57I restriction-modification methylase domain-containing protein [Rhodoblastus sp.]
MADARLQVQSALKALITKPVKQAATELFAALGYASRKTVDLDGEPSSFLRFVDPAGGLAGKTAAQIDQWRRVDFLFQLTNDEIPILAQGNRDLFQSQQDYRTSIIESFVFLAIELAGDEWTRGGLAGITREINRLFPMPAVILFTHGDFASLAVIDRRPNKKDGSRDVVEKRISIVKDINLAAPHRAHVDILYDIALSEVKVRGRGTPTNFRDLYDGWIEALSAQALNTRFYRELANWFFWSVNEVTFPAAAIETDQKKRDEQNQIAVIRLLTRLIFVWFIKEKGLVPEALFEPDQLDKLLNENPANERDNSTYYKAVLQNLFFATLNTEMTEDRKWRTKVTGSGLDGQYLIHSVYRFRDAFREPEAALALFKQVPFLNGGLFECLDREVSALDLERNPDLKRRLVKEGNREVIRIDGFSERPGNPLEVPNKIFFARAEKVDLNEEYDTKGKAYEADGLIELFSRYKFTVEENTPVEEEVALDPELLGKVFENLLASYNADTRTTARKKSGSFYTPREVVDYMVDEALIAYFSLRIATKPSEPDRRQPKPQMLDMAMPGEFDLTDTPRSNGSSTVSRLAEFDARLRNLLSFKETGNPFSGAETDTLVAAIDSLKALDPACGSGAFPMGLLQKLIHVLHRLDPDNVRWKAQNRGPLEQSLAAAHATVNPADKEKRIEEAEAALAKLDHDFSDANKPDYARKLYLIDKCLFGVDIQPIAVQIAKLRFFISLVVSQKIDRAQDNANITALPNLETKLVAANSLIRIERPAQSDLFRNTKIAEKEAELRGMNARYFSARTARTKRARRDDIARLRDELAGLLKSDRGLPEGDARKMAAWDPFDQNAAAPFFDPEWMFGLSSNFDLVIGNPPYVRHEAIKAQKPLLEKHFGGKDKKGNPLGAYAGTADLFVYFMQRGVELLSPGGAFAYITSNKWYRAKYGTNLRGWMNRQTELRRIVDFGDAEVFDAIAYPTIIIAARRSTPVQAPNAKDSLRVMNWPADRDKSEVEGFPKLVDEIGFDMPQKALGADGWQLEPQVKRGLLERIRSTGTPLKDFVSARVYRGITTGFNNAFVIDGLTKDRLIAEHRSAAAIILPYLRGTDVERWHAEPKDLWLIKIPSSENVTHPWSGSRNAEAIFALTYPSIYKFMIQYRNQLVDRYDQGKQFWELRSCKYWEDFSERKILSTKVSYRPSFCVDRSGSIIGNTAYFIKTGKFDNFLLSILNSSISEYYSRNVFSSKQGGFYEVQPDGLEAFPVPRLGTLGEKLVNQIDYAPIAARDPRFEQLLNGFVYELFFRDDLHARGLTLCEEAEKAGLSALSGLEGSALVRAAESFAATHLVPGARLRTMLSDLAALDVVRIIEGRE